MSTCGECKNYSGNTCYSLDAAPSLLDMFYATTPACEHFEARRAVKEPDFPVLVPQMRGENRKNDPLDMLSPETRDKMARQDRQPHRGALPRRYWPGEER